MLMDTAKLVEHLRLIGGENSSEIQSQTKEVVQAVREAKRVARKYQGQGIALGDVPDNSYVPRQNRS